MLPPYLFDLIRTYCLFFWSVMLFYYSVLGYFPEIGTYKDPIRIVRLPKVPLASKMIKSRGSFCTYWNETSSNFYIFHCHCVMLIHYLTGTVPSLALRFNIDVFGVKVSVKSVFFFATVLPTFRTAQDHPHHRLRSLLTKLRRK